MLSTKDIEWLTSIPQRMRCSEPLHGKEKENMRLILELSTPVKTTHNQLTVTKYFLVGDQEYSMTWFNDNEYQINRTLHT